MKNRQDIFLEHFEPLKKNLWRFCLSVSPTYDDAKDLLQDTIETAYREFENLKHKEAFLSWMFSIASRLNNSYQSKRCKTELSSEKYYDLLESNELTPDRIFEIKLLYQALEKLPIEQKEAIVLCNILGYPQNIAAEIQNVKLETLKQRILRGKSQLKILLSSEIKTTGEFVNHNPVRQK
ncbi:MAG: RNA polymerase sigma factor [Candidatus Kapabacteria bacterium]|nr:RNA polymerase sigma factor [Candidatus Kapabacteria bacterium]